MALTDTQRAALLTERSELIELKGALVADRDSRSRDWAAELLEDRRLRDRHVSQGKHASHESQRRARRATIIREHLGLDDGDERRAELQALAAAKRGGITEAAARTIMAALQDDAAADDADERLRWEADKLPAPKVAGFASVEAIGARIREIDTRVLEIDDLLAKTE